jgi:hypothetical protein
MVKFSKQTIGHSVYMTSRTFPRPASLAVWLNAQTWRCPVMIALKKAWTRQLMTWPNSTLIWPTSRTFRSSKFASDRERNAWLYLSSFLGLKHAVAVSVSGLQAWKKRRSPGWIFDQDNNHHRFAWNFVSTCSSHASFCYSWIRRFLPRSAGS